MPPVVAAKIKNLQGTLVKNSSDSTKIFINNSNDNEGDTLMKKAVTFFGDVDMEDNYIHMTKRETQRIQVIMSRQLPAAMTTLS